MWNLNLRSFYAINFQIYLIQMGWIKVWAEQKSDKYNKIPISPSKIKPSRK